MLVNFRNVTIILISLNLGLLFQMAHGQLDFTDLPTTEPESVSAPSTVNFDETKLSHAGLEQNGLLSVISALPRSMRELFARSYISSRLRRYSMFPGEKSLNLRKEIIRKPLLGRVPIIPEGVPTPEWIPGELIASQVTKRQLKLIDESIFGPLKAATMFPSVMSTILVFNKRYDPIRLAEVLKYNFGIEAEPNGMISEYH